MKKGVILGWIAVLCSTSIATCWAVWGTIENFHEGWYSRSLLQNVALALVQYLIWPMLFAGLAALGVWKPKLGAALFLIGGLALNGFLFHFQNAAGLLLMLAPCVILALLFMGARFPSPKRSMEVLLCPPIAVVLAVGTPLLWKVSHRRTDVSCLPLVWEAGGKRLTWAPPGPGWPKRGGLSPQQAARVCSLLDADGTRLLAKPAGIWRLPTVQETVEALNQGGAPAGCRYEGPDRFSPCDRTPDKEAPLWNPYSPTIYWWTSSFDEKGRDLRVAYNGYVLPTKYAADYTGFRAVK